MMRKYRGDGESCYEALNKEDKLHQYSDLMSKLVKRKMQRDTEACPTNDLDDLRKDIKNMIDEKSKDKSLIKELKARIKCLESDFK